MKISYKFYRIPDAQFHVTAKVYDLLDNPHILTDKRNATHVNCSRNFIHLIYFKSDVINLISNYPKINMFGKLI